MCPRHETHTGSVPLSSIVACVGGKRAWCGGGCGRWRPCIHGHNSWPSQRFHPTPIVQAVDGPHTVGHRCLGNHAENAARHERISMTPSKPYAPRQGYRTPHFEIDYPPSAMSCILYDAEGRVVGQLVADAQGRRRVMYTDEGQPGENTP